jgi:anaerobic magnesium-protoporphyrin IX monomethyl ester cyclase
VWMGAESGSQKILDAMDKGITTEQIRKATRLLKEHGIRPSFFIQFGYTGEDKEDIRKTIHMINELLPHEIGISVSYPLPGTVFYESVKAGMQKKSNWTDSDDLSLMFTNTYPSDFYKKLHRYLHHHFHRIKATEQWKIAGFHFTKLDWPQWKNAMSIPYYFVKEIVSKPSLTIN